MRASKIIEGEYIIIYKNQFENRISKAVGQQAKQLGKQIISTLNIPQKSVFAWYSYAIKGFAAELTDEQVAALKKNPLVKSVTPNLLYRLHFSINLPTVSTLLKTKFNNEVLFASQKLPWGVSRVNGPLNGTGLTAYILDSGIDLNHPDLNVDAANSASFIADENADDLLGHGTYVAGILAAKNNSSGVVGIAAGATVVSIKVCNQNGGCPKSSILNGVDYISITAQSNDIVNMSLGGAGDTQIDNAVINAANNGVRIVISAGNNKTHASNVSPARVDHQNVWTVSAFREGDEFSVNFSTTYNCGGSNYGNPPVDYSAPGENVPSLLIGGGWGMGFGGTCSEDGTSYAAPHIAGLLLAAPNDLTIDGYVSGDPDGDPDPILVYDEELPLTVTITGPYMLNEGETGTWQAAASNGDGSYSYQWYYRHGGFIWIADGTDSPTYSQAFYNIDQNGQNAYVKVVVDDGSKQGSDIHSVFIRNPDCPPNLICAQ